MMEDYLSTANTSNINIDLNPSSSSNLSTIKPGSYNFLYTSSVVNHKYTYNALNYLFNSFYKSSLSSMMSIIPQAT
jgi:hypothetical protein